MEPDELIILGVCIFAGLNLYATYRTLRSQSFESSQKISQIIIIWVLPIVGAALMLYFSDKDDDDFGSGSSSGEGHDSLLGINNGGGAD